MKDFAGMMKQAQKMQEDIAKMQAELESLEIVGAAGAGLVKVAVNGKGEARSVSIDRSLFNAEEAEVLEDLLVAAINDGRRRAEEAAQERMREAAGALGDLLPPGFKLPS
ncbi:MAG: YbaB/EbfC family nucleoid-associated protein [Caulobacterales bacterium]|nr:YbaB/EbfC family nucleoid-associated protein [Caulobacterales bacterium]